MMLSFVSLLKENLLVTSPTSVGPILRKESRITVNKLNIRKRTKLETNQCCSANICTSPAGHLKCDPANGFHLIAERASDGTPMLCEWITEMHPVD
jgi:hypothetical protein